MVGVLYHLADAGFGDEEVLGFLTAWAEAQPDERNVVAGRLRVAASLVADSADPRHREAVGQWIELLAALEAWHHLRAAIARSSERRRRQRPLVARGRGGAD